MGGRRKEVFGRIDCLELIELSLGGGMKNIKRIAIIRRLNISLIEIGKFIAVV